MSSVLYLAASKWVNSQQLTSLPSLNGNAANGISVATSSGNLTTQDFSASKFQTVISSGPVGHHSVAFLGTIASALLPGGKLIVIEDDASEALKKNLMLSGFVNAQSLEGGQISAEKPNWETGTKAAITFKPKPAAATWTLNVDDDDELVDEDDLLTEEDLKKPITAANDDCEVGAGGKKACANCTCGRADGEERKLTKEMIENPTSGCGSCALGDAFRCAGCPYRGLPAFEMGKKIELPSDFIIADLE